MKAFSLTLLTGHDSAQLNRKAIIAPKAFFFHQKKDSPFPLNFVTWRAFLKRPENFSGPETVPQSSRNDFRVFLKAPEKF